MAKFIRCGATVVIAAAAVCTWTILSPDASNNDGASTGASIGPLTLFAQSRPPHSPIRLLAGENQRGTTAVLTPTNTAVDQSFLAFVDTPVLFEVAVPSGQTRTHVFLVLNQSHSYHQVQERIRFNAGFVIRLASDVLPVPGEMGVVSPGADGVAYVGTATGAAEDVIVRKGFTRTEAFDVTGVSASIQSQFGFDAAAARALASELLRSEFTIRISPGVTVRGIDRVEFQGLRSLWVYGN